MTVSNVDLFMLMDRRIKERRLEHPNRFLPETACCQPGLSSAKLQVRPLGEIRRPVSQLLFRIRDPGPTPARNGDIGVP